MADSGASTSSSKEKEVYDERIDFLNGEFNPLEALNSRNAQVPVPDARVFDNIAAYKSHKDRLESGDEVYPKKRKEPEAEFTRKWLPHQLPIHTPRTHRKRKDVFTVMSDINGPLSALMNCIEDRIKVKILTRNHLKIRGHCEGYVVMFDKHWNILLDDVDEIWEQPRKSKVPAYGTRPIPIARPRRIVPPQVTVIQSTKKKQICKRHVDRFLLRGEHIVTIQILDKECEENVAKKIK